jgi:ferric iron reductase protein FhuF
VTAGLQAAVAARVPGAAALGLLAPPSAAAVPAALLADAGWTAGRLPALGARYGSGDRRVPATVWWYSASSVLHTPALAGPATGLPLSARLADTSVAVLAGGTPVAAASSAPGGDTAGELRETLAAVVDAVAAAGRMRARPLWAVAADSLGQPAAGAGPGGGGGAPGHRACRTTGRRRRPAAAGAALRRRRRRPLHPAGVLLPALPAAAGPLCTSCPRRPAAERQVLLEDTAARMH